MKLENKNLYLVQECNMSLSLHINSSSCIQDFSLALESKNNFNVDSTLAFAIESTNKLMENITEESYIIFDLSISTLNKIYLHNFKLHIDTNPEVVVKLSNLKLSPCRYDYEILPNREVKTHYRLEGTTDSWEYLNKETLV